MYKHWKKILLALTAFFWNACDNNSSPTGPVGGSDSSSSTTNGGNYSSLVDNQSSSSVANPSSSSVEQSSSSVESSSSTPVESSSSDREPAPLYGVFVNDLCMNTETEGTYACSDGVTCVESSTEARPLQARTDITEVNAKYGVIIVKNKTYTCSDGKIYNEAEFRARYDILIKDIESKKTHCYMNGKNAVDCDDGESYTIVTDEKGNKTYSNASAELSEKKFFEKYELIEIEQMPVLYGPPCVFDGTCGDEEK